MTSQAQIKARYSHSGICVADLERAKRFYREAFGFIEERSLTLNQMNKDVLATAGDITLRCCFMRLDGLVIELVQFDPTPPPGEKVKMRHKFGLTHLSFRVDNLDTQIESVIAAGGRVLASTRSVVPLPDQTGEIIFVADPDGTRIEVSAYAKDVWRAS